MAKTRVKRFRQMTDKEIDLKLRLVEVMIVIIVFLAGFSSPYAKHIQNNLVFVMVFFMVGLGYYIKISIEKDVTPFFYVLAALTAGAFSGVLALAVGIVDYSNFAVQIGTSSMVTGLADVLFTGLLVLALIDKETVLEIKDMVYNKLCLQ